MNLWFPIGYNIINSFAYKKPLLQDESWQILKYEDNSLLIVDALLLNHWLNDNLLESYMYSEFLYDDKKFYCLESNNENILSTIKYTLNYIDDNDVLSFYAALKKTRDLLGKETSLHDGIFIEKYSIILPTYSLSESVDDEYILGNWITGGVNVSIKSKRRILQLSNISEKTLLEISDEKEKNEVLSQNNNFKEKQIKEFYLPGRPGLESFFNEHVIDIVNNKERYKALGVGFPSAVILYGPPGSGKTYAVEQLVNLLDWPSFRIESSSVASPYIHETSKKIAEVFEKAIQNSPSIIIIDEMEAFLSDRDNAQSHHNIEEMAEFLRRIPEASENKVLIIGMTNKIDMIDPAILRRGRFDHIINVDYASKEEIISMLRNGLSKVSSDENINIEEFASQLSGRPLSDVSFFLKEGARLAARSGKSSLDSVSLKKALSIINKKEENKPIERMGFI